MKTKKIVSIFLFWLLLYQGAFSAYYNYNIANIKLPNFNNGLPISTGNMAGVQVKDELTFSGFELVSDAQYNIATARTQTFNNGLPISTGKVAKVITDKTIGMGTGESISNDVAFNVATMRTRTFNNGLPISTGKVAKVMVDNVLYASNSGSEIKNEVAFNIATARSLVFNSGLPISTGKSAKVEIDYTLNGGDFLYGNDIAFNLATVRTTVFNNGLPISSGKSAKVIINVAQKVDEYTEQYFTGANLPPQQTFKDEHGNTSYTGTIIDSYTTGSTSITGRDLYTNATHYVYLGKNTNPTGQQLEIYNGQGGTIKKINKSHVIVHGTDGYFQKIIKKNNNGSHLKFGDQMNLSTKMTSSEVRYYRQTVNIVSEPLPPVLTYPFYSLSGSESYVVKTYYPTIQGMAFPKSSIKAELNGEKYYIQVNNEGLYQFTPKPFSMNGDYILKMQYELLDGKYTTYLLKKEVEYKLQVRSDQNFTQPYISNIYNDDDMYSDVMYFEGYANPGILNYAIKNIGNTQVLHSGSTIVGSDKRFELLILEKEKLPPGNDYIIEMWNTGGNKERKAFSLIGNSLEKIGVLNISDYETVTNRKPVIIGYSKVNITNNDTIRGYGCEIGSGSVLDRCREEDKKYLGAANADKNGIFIFEFLQELTDDKMYLIELYNTNEMGYKKNLIIKTQENQTENIIKSRLINIYNGIKVNTRNLQLKGMTQSGAQVEIQEEGGSIIGTLQANEFGSFQTNIILPSNNIFKIKYSKGGQEYIQNYKLEYDENHKHHYLGNSYYQDFEINTIKIVDWR